MNKLNMKKPQNYGFVGNLLTIELWQYNILSSVRQCRSAQVLQVSKYITGPQTTFKIILQKVQGHPVYTLK